MDQRINRFQQQQHFVGRFSAIYLYGKKKYKNKIKTL